jgi:glycosyltransferase involved in cell wall biosynthesis
VRVAIDGYNIAMPEGTGVATYGVALADTLKRAGYGVEGVFGLAAGTKSNMREMLFFDRLGRGHQLGRRKLVRDVALSVSLNHLPRRLTRIAPSGDVELRAFSPRVPAFDAFWTSPLLFEIAYARFRHLGRFLTVTMPDPPEVMHWTYPLPLRMRGARNIYTIHDLVPIKLPHTTRDDKVYYRRLVTRCVETADRIVTVSEASRRDTIKLLGADPANVVNTYQASPVPPSIRENPVEEDAAVVESVFGVRARDFFLFYGALDPKKNIGRIVDAYLASQSKRPLVIVSSRDWGMDSEVRMFGDKGAVYGQEMRDRIIRLQYLPRPMLFRLIRSARAVLFPSLYEGFGLPVLEAQQMGTPVITANTSSLPEVAGDAALLVDPYASEEIAAAIRRIDADDDLVAYLSRRGREQAAFFSEVRYRERLDALYQGLAP